jgi:hypothetical protein
MKEREGERGRRSKLLREQRGVGGRTREQLHGGSTKATERRSEVSGSDGDGDGEGISEGEGISDDKGDDNGKADGFCEFRKSITQFRGENKDAF